MAAAGELPAIDAPCCPQCGQAMRPLDLEGHYGQQVPADTCGHCHLVWFDAFESVRLSGLGWVRLLRSMQAAPAGETAPLKSSLGCPRCSAALKPVHNLTRFGRFAALECPRRHGHLQTFTLLLAERGLVRPLGREDWRTLAEENRAPCCFNCGAGLEAGCGRCSYCDSPLVAIDMPRLVAALLVRHAESLPPAVAERVSWPCLGCGAPLAPAQSARCDRCHHVVVVPSALDLKPLLDAVEPLLRAALPRQARPHGAKLKALRANPDASAFRRYLHTLKDIFLGR
jgi:hypothetical protein